MQLRASQQFHRNLLHFPVLLYFLGLYIYTNMHNILAKSVSSSNDSSYVNYQNVKC